MGSKRLNKLFARRLEYARENKGDVDLTSTLGMVSFRMFWTMVVRAIMRTARAAVAIGKSPKVMA